MSTEHTVGELLDLRRREVAVEETAVEETAGDLVNLIDSSVKVRDGSTGHGGDNGEQSSDSSNLHCD